jgi:ADP-L-glycero-D-manno-heptose 6-epimerase
VSLRFAEYLDKDEFRRQVLSGSLPAPEAMFHQGACTNTTEWDGRFMMDVNYRYSLDLLEYCLAREVPFIYASSAAVYGASSEFRDDDVSLEKPLNVYGYSKLQFDRYVRRVAAGAKSQVVGLRYFNVYGPREQHKGAMASVAFHFNNQIREENEARLFKGTDGYADGEQLRDFVFVDDICDVNRWFLEHPDAAGIFNVGTGRAQSFNDVANAVIRWHDKGKIRYVPFPDHLKGAYQNFTQADLTQLRRSGCDVEFRSVEDGVKEYLDQLA